MMFVPPPRAPFACDPAASRGRRHPQRPSPNRTEFQRDRDRVIHASAFRRLKQKTQVFVAHEGDHYRTRLTHSLEVAQIARSVARALGLDEDLAETLALVHDIGHPPFGHAGEEALAECMREHGGFDHNAQSLRVVTALETVYPDFDGLNLTWETLEGLVKHNGPLLGTGSRYGTADIGALPAGFRMYDGLAGLEPDTHAGAEAQIAALADDIAYNNHDLDDGLAAGLFEEEELSALPLVGDIFAAVRGEYPRVSQERRRAEAVRRLIGVWVADLIRETRARLDDAAPSCPEDVRRLGRPVAAFSSEHTEKNLALRKFFVRRMYRHVRVNEMRSRARRVISGLFELYLAEPDLLPEGWQRRAVSGDPARVVCDYIAGMTDVFAIDRCRRLFAPGGAV